MYAVAVVYVGVAFVDLEVGMNQWIQKRLIDPVYRELGDEAIFYAKVALLSTIVFLFILLWILGWL